MVRDAVRGYWALAGGLSEVTRTRATSAARALVAQGEATAEQVGAIAEDLISSSLTNRAALVEVVRHEVDRARGALGAVTAADHAALVATVAALQARVAALEGTTPRKTTPRKTTPNKTTASKTKASKTNASKTTPNKVATRKTTASKSAASKATARKTAPRKSTARKSVPRGGSRA